MSESDRPTVALFTRLSFWRQGGGARMRELSLVRYLATHFRLVIGYLGPLAPADGPVIKKALPALHFVHLNENRSLERAELQRRAHVLLRRCQARACLIDHLRLAFLRPAIPSGVASVIDTHDLVFQQIASLQHRGLEHELKVSAQQEWAIYRTFDRALFIQEEEFRLASQELGAEIPLLVPHPVQPTPQPQRADVSCIGFVGSNWTANIDGMNWFLAQAWPQVRRPGLRCAVYGNAAEGLRPDADASLDLQGFVPDLQTAYRTIDIAINPVQCGSGLKIKSVEALANGLPLVSTSQGASGLDPDTGALIVADAPDDFAAALERFAGDADLRKSAGAAASSYVERAFSPRACYGPLLAWLHSL